MAMSIVISCCVDVVRKFGLPIMLVFTIVFALLVGVICATTKSSIVLTAAGITAVVVVGLTIFACIFSFTKVWPRLILLVADPTYSYFVWFYSFSELFVYFGRTPSCTWCMPVCQPYCFQFTWCLTPRWCWGNFRMSTVWMMPISLPFNCTSTSFRSSCKS